MALSPRDRKDIERAKELLEAVHGPDWQVRWSVTEKAEALMQAIIAVRLDAIAAAIHNLP